MFDVIEVKYNTFYKKIKDCNDFEVIINLHNEFLHEILNYTFVKSKKIMRLIFDILFITRKFHNYVEKLIHLQLYNNIIINNDEEMNEVNIKQDIENLIREFQNKCIALIDLFRKIQSSKYYSVLAQLLTKIDNNFKGINSLI